MARSLAYLMLLFTYVYASCAFVFSSQRNAIAKRGQAELLTMKTARVKVSSSLLMRDASSAYWFKVGDTVEVVEDVLKAGINLKGRVGTVTETWEKCDVDPTCCCAEFVDAGFAVHVEFRELDKEGDDLFIHFFAEDELKKSKDVVPFDGMSCTAFKLKQLNVGQKPRSLASYDPSDDS
uniref:Uncharacterized protein n=1 Tax=Odontella aurita TaxID=265563 RepID=A0A7S4MK47_9STRA|mmetsp:Transcript_24247/g.71335  ORF Transcript_24247/g.71335 Transcript_24247/m.71335 type:complete len:179 (+) Transcript_24247:82-618(+)|eukprot:CAMPEP_0113564004 /NCGR_PEP_ID=MMETSP0015_2-20120614/21374_1 /TAXON_ID=2838 /ORGANISM="Odontella" /LENGTH=178 /DNA_ID=CAMNT_0000466029 /DNA_START=76 /DNA_END=612 /DNA_ORIENTATION=+ /assembly_acc=CAM_ASM_000160